MFTKEDREEVNLGIHLYLPLLPSKLAKLDDLEGKKGQRKINSEIYF